MTACRLTTAGCALGCPDVRGADAEHALTIAPNTSVTTSLPIYARYPPARNAAIGPSAASDITTCDVEPTARRCWAGT